MRAETPELREELRRIAKKEDAKEKARREERERKWQSFVLLTKKYDIKTNYLNTKCNKVINAKLRGMSKELALKIKQNGDEDLLKDAWDFRGSCCPRGGTTKNFAYCRAGN